jgi:hypothetical protein
VIQEWDVEEPEPDGKDKRANRERQSWISIPLSHLLLTAVFSLIAIPVMVMISQEREQTQFDTPWSYVRIVLLIFSCATLLVSGVTEILSVCKKVFGWGEKLMAQKRGGQKAAKLRREIFFWLFTFIAPAALLGVFAEPSGNAGAFRIRFIPGIEEQYAFLYFILIGPSLFAALMVGILEIYLDTWAYRLRFGRRLRRRRSEMAALALERKWQYKRRIVDCFLVEWVRRPGKSKVVPYFKRDWSHLTWNPPASTVYDGWRSVFGYPENVLTGQLDGKCFHVFDYHDCIDFSFPATTSFSHLLEQNPTDFTVISIEEDYELPGLLVYPEAMWDKAAKRIGGTDIDMESYQFSEGYRVWSGNRKFAYDVCHGRAMEFLMSHPDVALRIEGAVRSVRFPGLVSVEELPRRLAEAFEFHQLLPGFLRDMHGLPSGTPQN